MDKSKRRQCQATLRGPSGKAARVQCGLKRRRKDFGDDTVLIAIPTSEDKLFCFPSLVQCLKDLLATTRAKCSVLFAVNEEDTEMVAGIERCGIPHAIVCAERADELPSEISQDPKVIEDPEKWLWLSNIVRARNTLRDHAVEHGFDWMFCLDSDTVVEPKCLNSLLSFGTDMASAFVWQRNADDGFVCVVPVGDYENRSPFAHRIPLGDLAPLPSPVFDARFPVSPAGLISRRVFTKLPWRLGAIAGVPVDEHLMFVADTARAGFSCALDHHLRTVHFTDEYDYPLGECNRMKFVSYEEIRR